MTEDFMESSLVQRADSKIELLKGVALLELILIISMKKLIEKDVTTFNFQMVYDEYKDFMNRVQLNGMGFGMKLYKRAVALKVKKKKIIKTKIFKLYIRRLKTCKCLN
jgi:origin recognition complex subunit 4